MIYKIKQKNDGWYYVQRKKWWWLITDRLNKSGEWVGALSGPFIEYTIWSRIEDAKTCLRIAMEKPSKPTRFLFFDKTVYETTD